jgi:hypothetical protein
LGRRITTLPTGRTMTSASRCQPVA